METRRKEARCGPHRLEDAKARATPYAQSNSRTMQPSSRIVVELKEFTWIWGHLQPPPTLIAKKSAAPVDSTDTRMRTWGEAP